MKRGSRICCTLALLLMSLGAVPSANAVGLLGFSPNPATFTNSAGAVVTVPGLPAWFQDQNGVAVQPCLDVIACGLGARAADVAAGDPGFDPGLPLIFPNNFPDEAFYFNVDTGDFQVGPFTANFVMAQEITFNLPDGTPTFPSAPGAVPSPFQRMRFTYTYVGLAGAGFLPPAAVGGNYTISTPWGEATFSATDPAMFRPGIGCGTAFATHDTKCVITRDLFSVPPDFVPALGNGTVPFGNAISTFLQDPVAPPGFLSSGLAPALTFTGAPPGRLNSFSVTDPLGNTGSTTQLRVVFGQKFGMEVNPVVTDFGALTVTTPATTSPAKTITVSNINPTPLTLGRLALAGARTADFAIGADGCSNRTLPAAPPAPAAPSSCTFTVTFTANPLAPAAEVASRTAMFTIPGTLAGGPAPEARAVLSGTAQFTMAASAGPYGAILPVGAAFGVGAGANQNFTITPNAMFQVKDITVNGVPAPFTKPANPTAAVTFTTPPITTNGTTINATFMPSGDLDGDGNLGVGDARKALNILLDLQQPVGDDLVAMKVTPLDASGRPAGTGAPDLNDLVLIHRRALGIVTW